jgi:hypothetical protein
VTFAEVNSGLELSNGNGLTPIKAVKNGLGSGSVSNYGSKMNHFDFSSSAKK